MRENLGTGGMLLPGQLIGAAENAAYEKAVNRPLKSFLLAVTAGAFIAFAFVFYVTTQVGAETMPWGVAKLVGGLVFSTGLILVVLTGAELFTSSTLTLTARASGRITTWQLLKNWGIVYLGNFVGATSVTAMIYLGGTWEQADGAWGAVVIETALKKVSHGFGQAVVLGIMCNLMVCIAIWISYAGKTVADKVVALILPVALFAAAGFEHSVANMFLIPLGIVIVAFAGEGFWTATGLDPSAFGDLTWASFLTDNLLPVTIGNIVGGGVMIGLLYWLISNRIDSPATAMKKTQSGQETLTVRQ